MYIQMSGFVNETSSEPTQLPGLNLEERLRSAFSGASEEHYLTKVQELARVQNPKNTSSPEDLYMFQTRASEYNLQLSLYAALTRKATTAIDTVLRA